MMLAYQSGRWIFLVFVLLCAVQDLKEQAVSFRIFLVMFAAETIWYLISFCSGNSVPFLLLLKGAGVGAVLFILNKITDGAIGEGDAFFFLAVGFFAGLPLSLLIFAGSLFLSGLFSLVILTVGSCSGKNMHHRRIPFLPFAAVPSVLLFLLESGFLKRGI